MCYVAVEPLTVRGDEGEPVTYQAGEPIPEADHWDPEIKRAYLNLGLILRLPDIPRPPQ
jgi:hypothetical protein